MFDVQTTVLIIATGHSYLTDLTSIFFPQEQKGKKTYRKAQKTQMLQLLTLAVHDHDSCALSLLLRLLQAIVSTSRCTKTNLTPSTLPRSLFFLQLQPAFCFSLFFVCVHLREHIRICSAGCHDQPKPAKIVSYLVLLLF